MNANYEYTLFNPKEFIDNINENKVQVSIYVEGQQVLDAILNKDKVISILEKAREIQPFSIPPTPQIETTIIEQYID